MKLFGSSGIRGKYGSFLSADLALRLGKSLGTLGYRTVVVGRDTRMSGETLCHSLLAGLLSSGCEVTELGILPTPVLCYATRFMEKDCGVMITASHNPAEDNGLKLWNKDGFAFSPTDESLVEALILKGEFLELSWNQLGHLSTNREVSMDYLQTLHSHFTLNGRERILLDAGNGAAFQLSPKALRDFGYDVVEISCDGDGTFPGRNPEPTVQTLGETARRVVSEGCQLGFCHDGDADRMVAIDDQGRVVDLDKFLVLLARELVDSTGIRRVVTTVDASMLVENVLDDVEIIRTAVGDVFVAQALVEQPAAFGGEPCGAYIFPSHGLWPDGVYAMFQTLDILQQLDKPLSLLLDELPKYPLIRDKISCSREKKQEAMECIAQHLPEARSINTIDGIRAEYGTHAVLIRPSGTEDLIRLNLEADSEERLEEEVQSFRKIVKEAVKEVTSV